MKSITLNKYNATLRLHGTDETRSLQLKTIDVKVWPAASATLTLTIIDEKDVPVYSRRLAPSGQGGEDTIPINEKFVFYDHLSLHLASDPEDRDFEAVVTFD